MKKDSFRRSQKRNNLKKNLRNRTEPPQEGRNTSAFIRSAKRIALLIIIIPAVALYVHWRDVHTHTEMYHSILIDIVRGVIHTIDNSNDLFSDGIDSEILLKLNERGEVISDRYNYLGCGIKSYYEKNRDECKKINDFALQTFNIPGTLQNAASLDRFALSIFSYGLPGICSAIAIRGDSNAQHLISVEGIIQPVQIQGNQLFLIDISHYCEKASLDKDITFLLVNISEDKPFWLVHFQDNTTNQTFREMFYQDYRRKEGNLNFANTFQGIPEEVIERYSEEFDKDPVFIEYHGLLQYMAARAQERTGKTYSLSDPNEIMAGAMSDWINKDSRMVSILRCFASKIITNKKCTAHHTFYTAFIIIPFFT